MYETIQTICALNENNIRNNNGKIPLHEQLKYWDWGDHANMDAIFIRCTASLCDKACWYIDAGWEFAQIERHTLMWGCFFTLRFMDAHRENDGSSRFFLVRQSVDASWGFTQIERRNLMYPRATKRVDTQTSVRSCANPEMHPAVGSWGPGSASAIWGFMDAHENKKTFPCMACCVGATWWTR